MYAWTGHPIRVPRRRSRSTLRSSRCDRRDGTIGRGIVASEPSSAAIHPDQAPAIAAIPQHTAFRRRRGRTRSRPQRVCVLARTSSRHAAYSSLGHPTTMRADRASCVRKSARQRIACTQIDALVTGLQWRCLYTTRTAPLQRSWAGRSTSMNLTSPNIARAERTDWVVYCLASARHPYDRAPRALS